KAPSPLPRSTLTVLEFWLTTARSALPSPLKSPVTRATGVAPTGKVGGAKNAGTVRSSRASRRGKPRGRSGCGLLAVRLSVGLPYQKNNIESLFASRAKDDFPTNSRRPPWMRRTAAVEEETGFTLRSTAAVEEERSACRERLATCLAWPARQRPDAS